MKNFISKLYLKRAPQLAAGMGLFLMTFMLVAGAFAQQKKRTYANFQGKYEYGTQVTVLRLDGSVTNEANAADANLKTASSLSVPVGALGLVGAIQYLEFTTDGSHANKRTIAANTPVSIKFTVPQQFLGAISGISVGSFTNLAPIAEDWPGLSEGYTGNGHNAGYYTSSTTEYYAGATLLGALSSTGEIEVTFSPTAAYNGIYLKLTTAVVGLGVGADLFHAYIMEDAVGDIACDEKIDVLSGIGSYVTGLDLATVTGTVDNPWGPIDNSGNGYATLAFAPALLDAYLYHRTIFNSPSVVGDTVSMTLRRPGGALLTLGLLQQSFSVQTFNGNVPGTQVNGNNALLNLQILPGNQEAVIKFAPTTVFDRVELRFGGLADVSLLYSSLELRAVSRIRPAPNVIQSTGAAKAYVFSGNNLTLSSTIPAGNTVDWFTGSSGGSSVHTGLTYDLTNVTANTAYYAQSSRSNCTENSIRKKVDVIVLVDASVALPVGIGTVAYPSGGSIKATSTGHTFTYSATMPIAGLTFNTATGAITANGTLPTVAVSTTYPITVTILEDGVATGLTLTKNLTVHPKLLIPGGTFPPTSVTETSYNKNISMSLKNGIPGNATGGVTNAVLKYSLTLPSLRTMAVPGNFSISESGNLSGDPSTAAVGSNEFTIYVNDGVQIAQAQYFLSVSGSLPVSLISFTVKQEGETATIAWSTSSETNSDRFEVERSHNNKSWLKIGNVLASQESVSSKPYSFVDISPLNGESLYRLKMIDRDGTFAYSRIESVNFKLVPAVKVYPNPIADTEKLQIGINDWSKVKSVRIINSIGKTVYESSRPLEAGIKTDNFSSGLYVVQIFQKDGKTEIRKFMKL